MLVTVAAFATRDGRASLFGVNDDGIVAVPDRPTIGQQRWWSLRLKSVHYGVNEYGQCGPRGRSLSDSRSRHRSGRLPQVLVFKRDLMPL